MYPKMLALAVVRMAGLLLCGTFCAALLAQSEILLQTSPDRSGLLPFRPMPLVYRLSLKEEMSETNVLIIPVGTILPVRLNTTISSAKNGPGKEITGRIMQDVPAGPGKIPAGSKVTGRIVEVVHASAGQEARVALQFDKVIVGHQGTTMTANLRAIAGFMSVLEAQTPPIGPSESDVYDWLTTVQIGGDVVYGKGGIVTPADNPNQIVGKEVHGGVLGKVTANAGRKCRGAIEGNYQPQALWVFSSDACGTYGLEHITIVHAGRTDPVGVIVLTSDRGDLKIAAGAGILLRVIEGSKGSEKK